MNILAIDSSAKAASAAIIKDNKLIGEFFINTKITHSQTLMPMVKSLLENTKTDINEIDNFAATVGPGSFTGVRIGVCACKGLAMANEKNCIGVSTLLALAYNLISFNCIACAVMDARRAQVYNAIFKIQGGTITRLCEDRALSIEELGNELKNQYKNEEITLVGDGANLCYNELQKLGLQIKLPGEQLLFGRAASAGLASVNLKPVLPQKLLPTYLRLPQAQRQLLKKRELLLKGD